MIKTYAVRDGDEYVINGHKWFASNAAVADFILMMVVTNPDNPPHKAASMIIIPEGHAGPQHRPQRLQHAPSVSRVTSAPVATPRSSSRTAACRSRIASAAKATASCSRRSASTAGASITRCAGSVSATAAFEMMCERAVSRSTKGQLLGAEADDPGDDRRLGGRDPGAAPPGAALRVGVGHAGRVEGAHGDRAAQVLGRARCSKKSSTGRSRCTARWDGRPTCRSPRCSCSPARCASPTAPTRCTRRSWPTIDEGVRAGRRAGRANTSPPARPSSAIGSSSTSTTKRRTSREQADGSGADQPGRDRRSGPARAPRTVGRRARARARVATSRSRRSRVARRTSPSACATVSTTGCCGARRCVTSSPPRTTWDVSTACSRRSSRPTCPSPRRWRRATTSR